MFVTAAQRLAALVTVMATYVFNLVNGGPRQTLALARVRSRRGAGMLEYAMVALISIAVFAALFQFFPGFFETITSRISERFNGTGNTPTNK